MRLHSIRVRRTESLLEVGCLIKEERNSRPSLISVLIMELWGALGLRTLPAVHPAESEMAAIATVVVMTRKFYTVFSPAPS